MRNEHFTSLDDFSRRVRLNRDDIIALCPAGVFDSIADGMPRQLQARKLLSENFSKPNKGQEELFTVDNQSVYHFNKKITLTVQDKKVPISDDDLWNEYKALVFLRNMHSLVLWRKEVLAVEYRVKAIHIGEYIGHNVKMVGWSVTQKDVWTKDSLTMSFLSLEDETAMYETVIFPQVYDRYSRLLFLL